MSILNTEELKRQIANGTFTGLDDITKEFKNILKEVIQTASEEELTSNYRNGYNDKTLKSKYGNINIEIPRDRELSFEPKLVKKREILLNGSEDMSVQDIRL